MGEQQTTSMNKGWAIKSAVIGLAFLAFGLWGLYDALVAYPNRGIGYALSAEQTYLQAAADAGRIETAGVDDPVERLERLRERLEADGTLSPRDGALLDWLDALRLVGRLDPAFTTIPRDREGDRVAEALEREAQRAAASGGGIAPTSPATSARIEGAMSRLQELNAYWATRTVPSRLRGYDIPSQWVILAVGVGVAGYIAFLFLKVITTTYRWDPETRTLTLPGGASITPDDLNDVDKRKWHKFIVYLPIVETHPKLGGQELRLDLYRHAKLEDWILEMERVRFPERAQEEAALAEQDAEVADDGAPDSVAGSAVHPADEDATRGA